MVGRWLAAGRRILLVDEPTAGVDVGAKVEIYRQLGRVATDGGAVLVVSSDFDELLGLCDRILVVRDGVIVDEVNPATTDVERLTALAADTTANGPAEVAHTAAASRRSRLRRFGVPVAMIAVIAALAIGAPDFLGLSSVLGVLRQASTPALLAAALAIALGAGAFDLSVGAVAQFSSTVVATVIVSGWPPILALLLGVVLGAAVGLINGTVTAVLRVPSFVATLGMLFLLLGITLAVNGGLAVGVSSSSFLLLGQGWIGPVPVVTLWAVLVVAGLLLVWRRTRVGLRWRAVGDDPATAGLRGVPVRRTALTALVASGAISGLAGVLMASYSSGASARDASLTLLVSALAAAFLGSAMTRGFLFDPATAACGALFVTAVGVGLISNGLSDQWLAGVQGLALLLAVLVAVTRRRALGHGAIIRTCGSASAG